MDTNTTDRKIEWQRLTERKNTEPEILTQDITIIKPAQMAPTHSVLSSSCPKIKCLILLILFCICEYQVQAVKCAKTFHFAFRKYFASVKC